MSVEHSRDSWEQEARELRSQLSACQRERERRFPLLDGPTVPWRAVEVHERQAFKNHGQTVRRLAERGGLSCAEFWFVMQDKEWECGKFKEAEILGRELANKLNSYFERAESLTQQLQQMREALNKIVGLCAPRPNGSHSRLDKIFDEIHGIYTEALYPEEVAAARALLKGKGE